MNAQQPTGASAPAARPRPRRAANRPVFRNVSPQDLLRYRMPTPAIVSILHRVSGALLFVVGIPFVLALLQDSLVSELGFARFQAAGHSFFAKLLGFVLIWGLAHHLVAGIRFLLLDLHIGIAKEQAAGSARITLGIVAVLTVLGWAKLFGVF